MPSYTFKNTENNEEFDIKLSFSEHDEYILNNPKMKQIIKAATPAIDPWRLGLKKPPEGFREVLRKIKKNSPGSTINTF